MLSRISDNRLQELDVTMDKVANIIELFVKNKTVEGIDVNRV